MLRCHCENQRCDRRRQADRRPAPVAFADGDLYRAVCELARLMGVELEDWRSVQARRQRKDTGYHAGDGRAALDQLPEQQPHQVVVATGTNGHGQVYGQELVPNHADTRGIKSPISKRLAEVMFDNLCISGTYAINTFQFVYGYSH